MSFSVKSLAFYLLPCIILVSCVPPEFVHPISTQQNETSAANSTGDQKSAGHPTVLPPKIPAPSRKIESANPADSPANKSGSNPPTTSIANKTGSDQPSVPTKSTTNHSIAAPEIHSTANSTVPSPKVANDAIPVNISSSSGTTLPPHHKKVHPSTVPPHTTVTHPHAAVPINPMPESENILEDVAHPAPRPLRVAEKFNPTFGAIVAAICITTAVGGYVILMAWRKIEMDRYGNRQMLINEDDFGDIQDEDMRHFEASCIQIDA